MRTLSAALLLLALSGCELVADFDRSKIPLPDAGMPDGAVPPPPDAGEVDAAPPDEDAGPEDDAG